MAWGTSPNASRGTLETALAGGAGGKGGGSQRLLQSPGDGPTAAKLGWHSAVTRPRDPIQAGIWPCWASSAGVWDCLFSSQTLATFPASVDRNLPVEAGQGDRTQTAPRATAPNPRSGSRTVPGWAGRDSKLSAQLARAFPCSSPASPAFLPASLTGAYDPGPQVGSLPTPPLPAATSSYPLWPIGQLAEQGFHRQDTCFMPTRHPVSGSSTTLPAEPTPYMISVHGGSQAPPITF